MILIDQDVAHTFRPDLQPREKVLWAGRPEGVTVDLDYLWGLVLMSVLSGIVITMFIWILSREEPQPSHYPGLIFGALTLLGFVYASLKDGLRFLAPLSERYALTNQRVLIRSGFLRSRLHSRDLPDIPGKIQKGRRLDFGAVPPKQKKRHEPDRYRFLGIDQAEAVESLFHQQSTGSKHHEQTHHAV